MASNENPVPVVAIFGTDPVLRSHAISSALAHVPVGSGRDEFVGEYDLSSVVMALCTPNLLGDLRVVVARAADTATGDIDQLVTAARTAQDAMLIIEWCTRSAPKALTGLVSDVGGTAVEANAPRDASSRGRVAHDAFASSAVRLSSTDRRRLTEHVGNDTNRLSAMISLLNSPGTDLTVDEVIEASGPPGAVNPWALDDAIDARDTAAALRTVRRLLGADRHPLGIVKMLAARYRNAQVLACGGELPSGVHRAAKRSAEKLASAGSTRVENGLLLLAAARADLTGGSALPAPHVMDVLAARLAAAK